MESFTQVLWRSINLPGLRELLNIAIYQGVIKNCQVLGSHLQFPGIREKHTLASYKGTIDTRYHGVINTG